MKLHIFNDRLACLDGTDVSKISCDKSGVLKIGESSIDITERIPAAVPMLFDGVYIITFTDTEGKVYSCSNTRVKNGRVVLVSTMTPGEIELRYRYEKLEASLESLTKRVVAIEKEYDFNALSFLSRKETEEN